MKCAAVITFVSVALFSQALAVLPPVFPEKSSPPVNGGTIIPEAIRSNILQSNTLVQSAK